MRLEKNVACPVCGCVCDDLELSIDNGRVVAVERACHLADSWFFQSVESSDASAQINGQPASLSQAVEAAADLVRAARSPLVYGLSRSSTPGQRAAIDLAERIGGTVDTTASMCHGPSIMALQEVGESTCSLGEIRNRADLVVFWGCNPAASHPRHAERYSVFPEGQFVPAGRDGRIVVMVGDRREVHDWRLDPNGAMPDLVVPIEPNRDFEAITVLRALLKGVSLDDDHFPIHQTGAPIPQLRQLIDRMKNCQAGVVFFGLGLTGTLMGQTEARDEPGHHNVAALLQLVAELNKETRFYARRMRLQGDVSGADSVLCWQTGFPFSVNLSRGYPRYNPGEFTANELLERQGVDCCVFVGCETVPYFSAAAREHLRTIPTVALDYPLSPIHLPATVRFITAPYGLAAEGTIYRMDEVPLPLRSHLPTSLPTDEMVLRRILECLGSK